MEKINIHLFGKFRVICDSHQTLVFESAKVQELFCYLLLNHSQPHYRDSLANLLWHDNERSQSKRYLSRTLWQLQSELNAIGTIPCKSYLQIDPEWIQLNVETCLWSDTINFEKAFYLVKGIPGATLDEDKFSNIQKAVQLYQGDLLEGCYQDWCLFERERFQQMQLSMLDKLMLYHEAHGDYESGIVYGLSILKYDRAREITHQRLMRLHYLAKDRTGALRQYEQCRIALKEELDVCPTELTQELYQQMRNGQVVLHNHIPPIYTENSLCLNLPFQQKVLDDLQFIREMLFSIKKRLS